MTVSLRQLRVSAEMDAGSYVAGARALEQSSASAGKAVTGLGATVKQTDSKIGTSGNMVERLNKRFIDGYASALQFEKAVNMVGRAMETGQIDMAHAERLLIGISQKYQMTANAADLLAAGQYDLSQAVTSANAVIETSSNVIDFNTAAKVRNMGATRNVAAMNRNLMFQLVDVGQALATAPTMGIYALQNLGFQFAQIGQLYAGQGGFKQAFTDSVPMIGRFAAKLAPVALIAGAVAAAFAGMQYEIREATGVSVGFGDVLLANLQVVGQGIYDFLQPAINAIAPWFAAAWELIVAGFKTFNNTLIRLGVGAFETIRFGVSTLPSAFIAAAEGAANGFVTAINWMVERTVAGFNAIIDAANYVSEKLGMGDVVDRFDASSYQVSRFDFGGKAALDEVRKQAKAYNEEMKAIAERDYLGRYFDAVADQSIANYNKRMDEAKKKTKSAMSEAEKALQQFLRTADQLVEKHFPGQAAAAEAEMLIRMLDEMGDALTDIQRKAVELEIDELFKKAAGEAGEAAKAIEQTLGAVLSDLFKGPLEDADQFFDKILSGFASLGQANLSKFFDGFLTGGKTAANDNQPNPWASLTKAVERGAAVGTESGASKGIEGLAGLFSGGGSNPLSGKVGGVLSAGLGGAGIGYETQSPVMGGIGGALSGFMAAGPVGAVVGGIFGILGGIFGAAKKAREEQEKAQKAIEENRGAIDNFLAAGLGQGLGVAQSAERKYLDQGREYRATAEKAGDTQLVNEIDRAMRQMSNLLRNDFVQAFNGTIESLEAGLGSNSPFTQAQNSIVALREELLSFIADTEWAGQNVDRARKATQDYALSLFQSEKSLSDVEKGMQRISGTAAGLGNTLLQLGMSASEASDAILTGLKGAISEMRSEFDDTLTRSINDLAGNGYINEIADAQERYNQRLKDAAALGLGAERANQEYSLALADIASRAGLSASELRDFAAQFGVTTSIVDDAQGALLAFRDLSGQIRDFLDGLALNSALSTLSPQERLAEAQRQFDETVALARQGDPTAQSALEAVSNAYLQEASSFYASTEQYASIFDNVRGTLLDLAVTAETEADRIAQIRDAAQQQNELLGVQIGVTSSIVTSIDALAASIAQLAGVTYSDLVKIATDTAAPAAPVVANTERVKYYTGSMDQYGNPQFYYGDGTVGASTSTAAGYATGGYTGDVGRDQVAGYVHGNEFVAHAEATRRWRPQLEAMNNGTYREGSNENSRENFRELGRMISAAVAAQTDTLKAENAALRDEVRRLKDETRIAGDKQARMKEAS